MILLLFTVFSCKEDIYSTIPTAPVSYKLNLNFSDNALNAGTGAYLRITQRRLETDRLGYGGLLIVNGIGTEAVNLYAYDLACPVEASRTALIVPENTSPTGIPTAITAKCPKCGAIYNMIDGYGTPQSGSKYYLRSYRVMKAGSSGEYVVMN
ncbi:hypothetical protein FACS189451_06290 [Bacteroidia bacterium]|nr:hypothetical protein FACS189451_06290 [Bacteroidia bacterium]GHU79801.1 hypothetical protein FACS1894145_4750 [Bacteroidia bacterium]